jgi:two-component system, cell cycle sensor histidine kinase and response regulator CckA
MQRSQPRAWNRIGLTGRLSIAMACAILIGVAVLLFTSVMHEKTHSSEELAAQLSDEMNQLLITLPEQVVIGDYATIEKILNSNVKSINIESIIYTDSYGKSISAIDRPVASIAPQWFSSLIDMPAYSKKEAIIIGKRKYGSVELHLTTTPLVNNLWSMFAGSMQALLLALALAIAITPLIVRYSLRSLFVLANGARRIGSGDYSARIPEQGTTEMAATIGAFNQMADQLTQTIDQLKRSKDKISVLYNETPIMLHSIDRTGTLIEVNDFWLKNMGYERSEVIGKKAVDFFTETSRKYALEAVLPAFFRDGVVKERPFQFVKKNGELVDVLLSATSERDADGNVVRSLAVIEDITERRSAEEALKESERRYRAIVENQAEFVVRYLPGGTLTFINDTMCKYLTMKRDELLGRSYYPFMHADDRESFIRDIESLTMNKPTMVAEARVVLPDGQVRWHKWVHSAIFDKDGIIIEYQATGRDITDSKRSEDALRSSEARFRTIIEKIPIGIVVADIETTYIRYANPEFCHMLGYSEEEFHSFKATDLAIQEELPASVLAFRSHAEGNVHVSERTLKRKDGSSVRMSINSVPMEVDGQQSLVGFFVDISEKSLLEEERLRSQKLEAISTLAGGIAHDFNNLLQGVFGYISLAKLKRNDQEKCIAALEDAEKALHLSVRLTNQLLTFSKGGKPVKKLIDLRTVIDTAAKFALSGSRSDYHLDVDAGLRQIEADEGQIGQVIQNLILNADQAMPEGGQVEVSARNVQAPGKGLTQGLLQGTDYVEIVVKDSGIGIPEKYLPKIFDPYFTTKEKGSGLGLATSYSIVKNHSGLIEVSSEVGKGTTFHVYLPATPAPVKNEQQVRQATAAAGRTGKVLVMDDEPFIRDVAGELLALLGHTVEFAVHGGEAIDKYVAARRSGKPFDVVILDLTIRGGMGGAETIQRLLKIDPGVKAIVSSGYSDDANMANFQEQGFKAVLKKPYDADQLQRVLNAVLAS